jgi:hypothetical protein
MSEQDNVFPFGKYDGVGDDKITALIGVINGLQNHMMVVLQKIDVLEYKLSLLEKQNEEVL